MVREQRRMHRRNPRATDLENARQARSEGTSLTYLRLTFMAQFPHSSSRSRYHSVLLNVGCIFITEADVEYDEGWFRNVWQFCRGNIAVLLS